VNGESFGFNGNDEIFDLFYIELEDKFKHRQIELHCAIWSMSTEALSLKL
jgi:hypothetical protein